MEGFDRLDNENKIVIYGAGKVANNIYQLIRFADNFEQKFQGFVVTNMENNPREYNGYSVVPIADVIDKDVLVVIGVGRANEKEVQLELKQHSFFNTITRDDFDGICNHWYYLFRQCSPDKYEELLKKWYKEYTGLSLDIDTPRTFNEKIQWLKLHDSTREKTILSDKYLVREWVKEKIGDKYLVPLLGVWDSFDEICFRYLPDRFVLKCNHGSGWNYIVNDKNEIDYDDCQKKINNWMKLNYAYTSLELHYKDIKPRIIAEEMLIPEDGGDLKDYKLFVFGGKVELIQVDIDRFHYHRRNLYTTDWKYVHAEICYPTAPEVKVEKPDCLEEMITLAETLGRGFAHVRVDFYLVNNAIYFGEMTFTHGSGIERFEPKELALKMGDLISIE